MKSRLILVGLLVIAVLSLVACTEDVRTAPYQSMFVNLTCDDFARENDIVDVAPITDYLGYGDVTLTILLCSNPTTGFSWSEEAQISDPAVLQQLSHEYVATDNGTVGAAGQEQWEFKALKEGQTTIYLEYSRPWEGGEKAEWTYTLVLTVSK